MAIRAPDGANNDYDNSKMVSSWSDVQLNTHICGPVGPKCRCCTFVDCSNYNTLEQLVALRWRYEMFVCLV